jgi:hypothetical protein
LTHPSLLLQNRTLSVIAERKSVSIIESQTSVSATSALRTARADCFSRPVVVRPSRGRMANQRNLRIFQFLAALLVLATAVAACSSTNEAYYNCSASPDGCFGHGSCRIDPRFDKPKCFCVEKTFHADGTHDSRVYPSCQFYSEQLERPFSLGMGGFGCFMLLILYLTHAAQALQLAPPM